MSAVRCARVSEAEAARDGRLGAAERSSFERHLPSCVDCREETRALAELAERLKTLPAPEVDQIAARRRRQRLLRDADAAAVVGARVPSARARASWIVAFAAVTLLVLGGFGLSRRRAEPPRASSTAPASPEIATIRARDGARFTRTKDGIVERIDLREGELAVSVRHSDIGEHVLVTMPDGELEDLGTKFVILVEAGATRAVSVQEGLVVLRLEGREAIHIAAGSSWARPPAPIVSTSVCPPATTVVAATFPAPKAKAAAPVADVASIELKAAMTSYRNGDHRTAAAKLLAFVQAHPSDPRSEDAAYVRIIALQRAGDHAAARVAAHDYLARYPKGFRRPEVEAMVR